MSNETAIIQGVLAQSERFVLPKPPRSDGVVLTNGADLTPMPINWLWQYWLAQGKFHILGGAPGQGKTTLAMAMTATVTLGGRWPDGTHCAKGNVLIWSGEDDPADTLLPRLIVMGADVSCVHFVTGSVIGGEKLPFDPARDLVALTSAARTIGEVSLLIVDPVVAAVTGDSYKNAEVRRNLQPLVDLGAALGAAVLGVHHFSKGGQGKDPTERITGSVAFGALARVVLVAAKSQGDDGTDRRILARSKSNVGPDDGGFEYSLDQIELDAYPGISASRVLWGKSLAGSARDLLGEAEDAGGDNTERDDAKVFLASMLRDGPVGSKQVRADCDGAGYAWSTIRRAQRDMGIQVEKNGFGSKSFWAWTLPKVSTNHEDAEVAHTKRVDTLSILGVSEHLSGDDVDRVEAEI